MFNCRHMFCMITEQYLLTEFITETACVCKTVLKGADISIYLVSLCGTGL